MDDVLWRPSLTSNCASDGHLDPAKRETMSQAGELPDRNDGDIDISLQNWS